MNETLRFLLDNQKDILSFLKTRYHLYHLSNVFFRDIHYGVMAYLEWKGKSAPYTPTEKLAQALVDSYVKAGILANVARNAFALNYPEFKKPAVKPAAPAKPAAPPAAQRPAVPPPTAKPAVAGSASTATQPVASGSPDQGS